MFTGSCILKKKNISKQQKLEHSDTVIHAWFFSLSLVNLSVKLSLYFQSQQFRSTQVKSKGTVLSSDLWESLLISEHQKVTRTRGVNT